MAREMYKEFPSEPTDASELASAASGDDSPSDHEPDDDDDDNRSMAHSYASRGASLDEALRRALIKQDEDTPPPIEGNIYKFFAFIDFGFKEHQIAGGATLFQAPGSRKEKALVMLGLGFIMLIQLFAPIAILATSGPKLFGMYDPFSCKHDSYSQWIVRILAWAFLFCFVLSVYLDTIKEKENCETFVELAHGLMRNGHKVHPTMLTVDAMVNSFAAIFLSLSLFVILFQESDAQGVVMDAMSLAFLCKIDDLASDFSFLGDIWDSDKIGVLYDVLKKRGFFEKKIVQESDEEEGLAERATHKAVEARAKAREAFWQVPFYIYQFTQVILFVILILATVAPLLFKMENVESVDMMKGLKDLHNLQSHVKGMKGVGLPIHEI